MEFIVLSLYFYGSKYTCSFVASRFYKLFDFELNENASLSPSFIQRVNNLSAFDESNYENVELWTKFFNDYGTHVVKSALVGGRIDIHVSSPSSISVESFKDKLFQTVDFAENVNSLITDEKIDPKRLLPTGVTYSLEFHGGNPSYHTTNLAGLNLEDAIKNMKNWRKSLKYDPAVISTATIPIDQVAQAIGSEKAGYIREALMRLYNSSLSYYVAPTPDPNMFFEELLQAHRENEETIKELAAEIKGKAAAQTPWESLTDRWAQSQAELELERERLRVQRIREEQELNRKLERERRTFLQQLREERRQAEVAARQRKLQHDQQMERIRQEEQAEKDEQAKLRGQKVLECCKPLCGWARYKAQCERSNP
ncbi:unnamed protein product [Orchesella dallaii]|uniref:MACPF domain-containing protein n=1 Tax=Orchesella dallaii TaxID=48710 RepID=A0ABP1S8Y1_9HEXA